ncbi:MAG TPA: class I SAM-dependent methyltransferase [Vicinamibacterales bacterium]|nr:class I SAM-dependent methyltransferase [Vicinamibacterales bacterium]
MSDATPRGGREKHWDSSYETGDSEVSWYQASPTESLELIRSLSIRQDAAVIDIGGGASAFVDRLVEQGHTDVTVLDISARALQLAQERLSDSKAVKWLHEDLLPWTPSRSYDLWHDRAVFHFLVTPTDQATYLAKLDAAVQPSGAVILGVFAPDGPSRCSGLPVARYSADELEALLHPRFEAIRSLRSEHVTPAGANQPFTWIAARRRLAS